MKKEKIEILNNNDYQKKIISLPDDPIYHPNILFDNREYKYKGTVIQIPSDEDRYAAYELNEYIKIDSMDTIYVFQDVFFEAHTLLVLEPTEWMLIYRTKNCEGYFE
jgi:hypothetical protein